MSPVEYAPIVAVAFAVPQFLPQIRRVVRSRDARGVSWAWAALTSVNNAAWFAYFLGSGYATALVPAASASALAGVLALALARRRSPPRRASGVALWASLLVAGFAFGGSAGLGSLLTAAFLVQVSPSIWTAYRTPHPTGISRGTWLLVLGELACWFCYGLYRSDVRLLVLGTSGIIASVLMLARTLRIPFALEPAR